MPFSVIRQLSISFDVGATVSAINAGLQYTSDNLGRLLSVQTADGVQSQFQLVYLIYTATKEDRLILHPRYAYQYGGPTYSRLIEANEFSPERPEKYCRHILPLEWHGSTVMQIAGEEFTAINYVEPHAG
jgi:hypothetical protein